MRRATAELIVKDPNKFAHHDRVFLNNPVVMQGMGLAPLVVLATRCWRLRSRCCWCPPACWPVC